MLAGNMWKRDASWYILCVLIEIEAHLEKLESPHPGPANNRMGYEFRGASRPEGDGSSGPSLRLMVGPNSSPICGSYSRHYGGYGR